MSKRTRSPNYPALGLPEALERLQRLWDVIQTHPASREDIAAGLGYSGLHGKSATAVSALKKYGLLERQGSDLKISERGMKCLHPESPQESASAIQDAAFEPELFATLTERFPGGRDNEGLLRNYLLRNNFNSGAAGIALLAYRETMELTERQSAVYDQDPAELDTQADQTVQSSMAPGADLAPPPPPQQGTPFRAAFDGTVLEGSFRLTTPEEIETLVRFLQLNKVMIAPRQSAVATECTNDAEGRAVEARDQEGEERWTGDE